MNPRTIKENNKRPRNAGITYPQTIEDCLQTSDKSGTVQNTKTPENLSINTDPTSVIDLTQSYELLPSVNWPNGIIDLDDLDSPPVHRRRLNHEVTESHNNLSIVINDSPARASLRRSNRKSVKKPAKKAINKPKETAANSNQDNITVSFFGDCPICFEPIGKNPLASTKCGHVFCASCLEQAVKCTKRCPNCRKPLNKTGYHRLYFSDN